MHITVVAKHSAMCPLTTLLFTLPRATGPVRCFLSFCIAHILWIEATASSRSTLGSVKWLQESFKTRRKRGRDLLNGLSFGPTKQCIDPMRRCADCRRMSGFLNLLVAIRERLMGSLQRTSADCFDYGPGDPSGVEALSVSSTWIVSSREALAVDTPIDLRDLHHRY